MKKRLYGWSKKKADKLMLTMRYVYKFKISPIQKLFIDLRKMCPVIYDQGMLGSCTAHAVSAAYQVEQFKKKIKIAISPSKLYIYYNTRLLMGTTNIDSGATLEDSLKSCNKYGICNEKLWGYNITRFTLKPPIVCYNNATLYKIIKYVNIEQSLSQLKQSLMNGYPFVFGFLVFESFESITMAKTGMMTMPTKSEQILGGHAVLCVGYNDSIGMFLIRNSWGTNWGMNGYFYMPYAYMINPNYCGDFWIIMNSLL